MVMTLHDILEGATKFGASDIHLSEDQPPCLRVNGMLRSVQAPPMTHEMLVTCLKDIMPKSLEPKFNEKGGVDFGYQYNKALRYRVNAYMESQRMKIVLRTISLHIPTIEDLELPEILKRISMLGRGLVLVTGATGSGKSTTLAAMIEHVNTVSAECIITIEDPIEFVYQNKKSIITQREVGMDLPDFNTGLVHALRQDPDIILIGEMRDTETMRVAIKAAETGHLVFSTLHTTNAVQTVERIITTFPEEERDLIREQIAFNLKSAISQRLMRRTGGKGRIAVLEIMYVNTTIEKLIYENRIRDIPGVISGQEDGMMLFDQALADLARAKKVDQEEAEKYCDDLYAFRRFVKGIKASGEGGGIISGF
jgi:twitching motility protein PilT